MNTPPDRQRALWAAAVGPALLAVLIPKCPVCVAAYLVLFGLSAGAASVAAPLLFPASIALCALAVAATLVRSARTRSERSGCGIGDSCDQTRR
jgi:hypothetical protein